MAIPAGRADFIRQDPDARRISPPSMRRVLQAQQEIDLLLATAKSRNGVSPAIATIEFLIERRVFRNWARAVSFFVSLAIQDFYIV